MMIGHSVVCLENLHLVRSYLDILYLQFVLRDMSTSTKSLSVVHARVDRQSIASRVQAMVAT